MSSLAQIRAEWLTSVFGHSSIQALTAKVYDRPILTDSISEDALLRHQQDVNYFYFAALGFVDDQLMVGSGGAFQYNFVVDVVYTVEDKPTNGAFNKVNDGLELVQLLVESEMGSTWNGLVSDYRREKTIPSVSPIVINNCECWQGSQRYTAEKNAA